MQKRRIYDFRHNKLHENIGEMLIQEVTNDDRIEPILQPLTGEERLVGGNTSMEARADISTREFLVSWE